jgi:hypothetical protein
MTNADVVQRQIAKFLKSTHPEVLCISGAWGVGKTFLWMQEVRNAVNEDRLGMPRHSYVSLFGLNSLESIKLAVFENSDGEALPNQLGPLYFATVRDQIVCFDDLERRDLALSIGIVLGLISALKEQRGCKVMLLLNKDGMSNQEQKELDLYFEKVIDEHLVFEPNAEDSAKIALLGDDKVPEYLRTNCINLGISNIRVIKKIEKFSRDVEPLLSQAKFTPGVLKQGIQIITLLAWAKFQPEKAPSLDFITTRRGTSYAPKEAQVNPREAEWNSLLDDYLFRPLDDFDNELLKFIQNGYYDQDALTTQAIRLSERLVASMNNNDFEDAWKAYHDSFENNQDETLDRVYRAFVIGVGSIAPSSLDGTVQIFKRLGRETQAGEILKMYMEKRTESKEFWDLDSHAFSSEVSDPDVRKAFKDRLATFPNVFDPVKVLIELSSKNSWSPEEFDAISKLTSDNYYEIFKAKRGRDLRKILRSIFMFSKIGNATPEMREIEVRARDALTRIGKESPINAQRVEKFGIVVAPEHDNV